MEKILLFGGSFNPIHKGHTNLIRRAAEILKTDKILVIPTGKSGYKVTEDFADSNHRLNMCRLEFDGTDIEVSTVETDYENQRYTYQTLEKLTEEYKNAEFYFLMGSDMFLSLHNWKNPDRVIELTNIAVALRDNAEIEDLKKYREQNFRDSRVIFLETEKIDISSTKIRKDIKEGKIPCGLSKSVYDYIKKNRLYI